MILLLPCSTSHSKVLLNTVFIRLNAADGSKIINKRRPRTKAAPNLKECGVYSRIGNLHYPDNYDSIYRDIGTFKVHNIKKKKKKKKRFKVTVVNDLRKVILKQTPPLYKRRIGHVENLIYARRLIEKIR